MHFLGICRTPEITCSTYLKNRGMPGWPFDLATPDSNGLTGQSFTIDDGVERNAVKLPVTSTTECDAIDSILISVAMNIGISCQN
jgi:hypothetical protein